IADLGDSVRYPRSTMPDGSWQVTLPFDWTSGFFPGSLWYLFEFTKDPVFEQAALRWTEGLEDVQDFSGTHDLGFMIFCSYGHANRLHPSETFRNVILRSARTLSARFHPTVGSIRSWDFGPWTYPVIIDNMMNLELLFWASEHGGSEEMREAAISHARTTLRDHLRGDGSTYHVVDYDTVTGSVIGKTTHQGYSDESTWARGQAWGIYGFTMTYRYTRDEHFLSAAEQLAEYFIRHLPEDGIPYWDFLAPGIPHEPKDASAAAIAASALFELSGYSGTGERREEYRKAAEFILNNLCSTAYRSEGETPRGILMHGVGNKPAGTEIDVSLVYADYYFIEAMLRYLRLPPSFRTDDWK
ncbi:MAG: glycoside hydrolase family 88 protein, partial [Bacteroidota bacterium]